MTEEEMVGWNHQNAADTLFKCIFTAHHRLPNTTRL